ncbi:Essential protein required for maturation of 18S rRNA [Saccharomyces cerevisiae]|nr:Essential protein required for maturation of 18S rRNA [Saccharomyces boulardii (nom. inval.)]
MGTAKQNQNRKKFTREYKVKEIQRSITKKTRLRKEYLKALKDEGYAVPEKEPKTVAKESVRKIKEARAIEGKKKLDEKKEIKKQRKRMQKDELNKQRTSNWKESEFRRKNFRGEKIERRN